MGDTDTAHFVGRQGELQALDDALNRARATHPAIVLVEGVAGIGKTALWTTLPTGERARLLDLG